MILDLSRLARGGSRAAPRIEAPTAGFVLGASRDGVVATWPLASNEHASHSVVLAASGAGKTILVASVLLDEFLASLVDGALLRESLVIIDPKGDLVVALVTGLAAQAPSELGRILYLNPFSQASFAFNLNRLPLYGAPVDIRAQQLANLCATVSTSTGAQRHLGVGARQIDVLQHVILGALAAPNAQANITWALQALTSRTGLADLAAVTTNERARLFLSSANLSEELRASCASRLRAAFCSCDQLARVVEAADCIDLDSLTHPGALTLIDLGSPPSGVESLTAFWANLLLRLLVERLMQRPSPWRHGHHTRLVIDEAQVVAPVLDDVAERLLTLGRSRGISLVTLSQGTTLINEASSTLLRVILTNASTKIVGRLAVADAELLAREQAPRLGVEESLSTIRGRFVATVTNLNDREFFLLRPSDRRRFVSREVDLATWQYAGEHYRSHIEACMNRLALPAAPAPSLSLAEAAREAGEARTPRRARQPAPERPRSPWG